MLTVENGQENIKEIQSNIYVFCSLKGKLFVTAEFALKHKKYKRQFVREVTKMNRQIPVYLQTNVNSIMQLLSMMNE